MVALTKLFLMATVAVASVIPRDAAQILADLKDINTKTNTLTTKANAYNGGVANAVPVQQAANDLDKAIKSATTDANNSPVATSDQATQIINYINNTLEPNVKKSVNAVIAKKAKYQADGLQTTVKNTFTTLKTDTDAFADALIKKTPSAQKSAATAAKNKIDADLQSGINAFS